jgi:hypothetical protein
MLYNKGDNAVSELVENELRQSQIETKSYGDNYPFYG